MKLRPLFTTLLLCLSAPLFAQETMAPVPDEMKQTDYLVGHWEGTMKMPTGPGTDMSMKGTIDVDKVLGGRYVREMHKFTGGGMGDMSGMLMLTYDPVAKNWSGWWFDSTAPGAMEMAGQQTGNATVMTSKPTKMAGQTDMVMRSTWTKLSDTKVSFKLEIQEGDKWTVFMSGDFEKKG